MEDITQYFSGCTLSTEEIREVIRKIVGEDEYYCYKCFSRVTVNFPKCVECYQIYCAKCSERILLEDSKDTVNPKFCPYCKENKEQLEAICFPKNIV